VREVPRAPRCTVCPLRTLCRARATNRVDDFPPAVARRAPVVVRRAVALVVRGGRMLMARREGPLLEGMWEPPGVDLRAGTAARAQLAAALAGLGVRAALVPLGKRVRHGITHRAITVSLWRGALRGAVPRSARLRWVDPARASVPLTALARRLSAR